MTRELQSTVEASGIRGPAMSNHIPCMVHAIQLALGLFMSCLGVKGCTKSVEAHKRDQQFWKNDTADIGKSQRLRTEGNARMIKVSAMELSLWKIIEKVCISRHFERPKTDLHIAQNASGIDYTDIWSSKWVHGLSKSPSMKWGTTHYGCEDTVEFDTGVAWPSRLITRIDPWGAQEFKIQWLQATFAITEWMDHSEVCDGSFKPILILDPLNVGKAYSNSPSCHNCIQWYLRSYGWHYAHLDYEKDSLKRILILSCEGCAKEAFHI